MKVLVLRKCGKNGESHYGDFKYPVNGYVEAPDWQLTAECGHGLHGLLWGHGTFDLEDYGSQFQVIEVEEVDNKNNRQIIEFDGKCKFKCGNVLYTGNQLEAITLIKAHPNYPKGNILNYDIVTNVTLYEAGDESTVEAGYKSTVKAGDKSTVEAGDESTVKAGYKSTVKAGYKSTVKAGDKSTVKAGYKSTVEAGYKSTVKAGDKSTVKAGDKSTVEAGDESTVEAGGGSTVKAGDESTVEAGGGSTVKAGILSVIIIRWYDYDNKQPKVSVNTITKSTANKGYKFENGKFNLVKD